MKGFLLVLSAPSGAGKTTIAKELEKQPDFVKSISMTTRAPREGEVHGVDYYFSTRENFEKMIRDGEMLESAEYGNNLYGTPKSLVVDTLNSGKNMVFTLEVNGFKAIKDLMPKETIGIYILPPSMEELEKRLVDRGDDAETIKKRLDITRHELADNYAPLYDYTVTNDDFDRCMTEINEIIGGECRK